jgi:hypothetical protein
MRKIITLFFTAVSICLISFQNSKATPGDASVSLMPDNILQDRNSISGFVFGEFRTPISSIDVELQNDVYSTVARVQTRGSGMFSFVGLPPGRYNVRVLASGTDYEEQSQSVSLVPISVIQGRGVVSEQINFYLKIKKRRNVPTAAPGVVFLQEVPEEARKLYDSGIEDLINKNETAAFNKLKKSLEIFPNYYLALDRLGTEYLFRGFYDPALILLTKALAVNSLSFSSTFGLGLAEFRLGRTDKAIDHFRNAIRISEASANAHLWLGIALHSKNNLSDALISILKANDLSNKTSAEVHWQLARVYKDQKLFSKAADELELFLKYSEKVQNVNEIKEMIGKLRQKNSG